MRTSVRPQNQGNVGAGVGTGVDRVELDAGKFGIRMVVFRCVSEALAGNRMHEQNLKHCWNFYFI